jgi:hypothetical protein
MIPHWVTDVTAIATPIVALAYAVINLMMKNSVSETNGLIREHIASDDGKHDAIEQHLSYTDKRVDRLEAKS